MKDFTKIQELEDKIERLYSDAEEAYFLYGDEAETSRIYADIHDAEAELNEVRDAFADVIDAMWKQMEEDAYFEKLETCLVMTGRKIQR